MVTPANAPTFSRRAALALAAGGAAAGFVGVAPAAASDPNPPGHGMWIGANRIIRNSQGRVLNDVGTWLAASAKHGPWTVRRTYSPNMAASIQGTLAQDMLDAGIHVHHSVKPPEGITWQQAVDGRYHDDLVGLANSMPHSGPTWLTVHHEPEGSVAALDKPDAKGTPEDFVAFHQYCYRIVKATNPNVQVGPIYMSYQWRPGSTSTAQPESWFVGDEFADFVAVDAYWANTRRNSHDSPAGMQTLPQFRRWYEWARKAYASARFGLTEFGYQFDAAHPQARAHAITATARFLTAENFFTMQYWDCHTGRGYALDALAPDRPLAEPGDVDAIEAYRAIAAAGEH